MPFKFIRCHQAIILFLTLAESLNAQDWTIRNYDHTSGLAHNTVFRIAVREDSLGVWMGTDRGLSHFDGHNWQNMVLEGKPFESHVMALLTLSGGDLELSLYHKGWAGLENETIAISDRYLYEEQALTQILSVLRTENGDRWIIDKSQGLFHFNAHGILLAHLPETENLFSKVANPMTEHANEVYVPCAKGMWKWDGHTMKLQPLNFNVEQVLSDGKTLWLAGKQGVYKWNGHSATQVYLTTSFRHLFSDSHKRLWLATDEGIYLGINGQYSALASHLDLDGIMVNQITEDYLGQIWLATYNQGVFVLSLKPKIEKIPVSASGMHDYKEIFQDSHDRIWVGSMHRLSRYVDGKLMPIRNINELKGLLVHIHETPHGNLFLGTPSFSYTYNGEVLIESRRRGVVSYLEHSPDTFWGGFQGLQVTGWKNPFYPKECRNNTVNDIVAFHGEILLATDCGLWVWNGDEMVSLAQPATLHSAVIHKLFVHNNNLYVGSSRGFWHLKNGEWRSYNTTRQCPVYDISTTDDGRIWLGTEYGLYELIDTGLVKIPLLIELSNHVLYSVEGIDSSTLLCGSTDYLFQLNVNDDFSTYNHPKTVFTELWINGQYTEPRAFSQMTFGADIQLSYNTVDLGPHTEYSHRVELWHEHSLVMFNDKAPPDLYFHGLKSGSYALKVFITNAHNAPGTTLRFKVARAWWQKPIGIVLAVCVLIGFGFTTYLIGAFIRRLVLRKRKARELQLVELRHKALSAMMNPHFIFNALNSIQHFITQNDLEESSHYTNAFARLIRLHLEQVNSEKVPLSEEIERLQLYCSLEQLRFSTPFEITLHNPQQIDFDDLEIPPLLLQPFVENAIHHGILPANRSGSIDLYFSLVSENRLEIRIIDNGVGYSDSIGTPTEHNSLAISLIRERLQIQSIGNSFDIHPIKGDKGNVLGTEVRFTIAI